MSFPDKLKREKYDAIIVGGGTAGLVAAARLSEDASKKILVIEAGADRRGDAQIDIPGMLMSTWGNPTYDWDFWSTPQVYSPPKHSRIELTSLVGTSWWTRDTSTKRESPWWFISYQCDSSGVSNASQFRSMDRTRK